MKETIDDDGRTCLMLRCIFGFTIEVKRCLAEGADIERKDFMGKNPLTLACLNNHVDVVRILIENDVNLNAIEPIYEQEIIELGNPAILEMLYLYDSDSNF